MPDTTIYHKTIVRLWHNSKYGKGMGPKQINRFVFNGSVGLPTDNLRLHVDLAQLEHYPSAIDAKSAGLFEQLIVELCNQLGWDQSHVPNIVMGQLFELSAGQKQFVDGAVFVHTQSNHCVVLMFDEHLDLNMREEFPLNHCLKDKQGKRSPDYFGSNFELEAQPTPTTVNVMDVLAKLQSSSQSASSS